MTEKTVQRARGFTLIELLVVIAIIGLLSAVVIASLNSARLKGRDARRIQDLKQLQTALELAYDASNPDEYPESLDDLDPTYIAKVPTDPNGGAYTYHNLTSAGAACTASSQSCIKYVLAATLEDAGHDAFNSGATGTVGPITCGTPLYCIVP